MKLDHFLFLWRLALIGIIVAAFRCQGGPPPSTAEPVAGPVVSTAAACPRKAQNEASPEVDPVKDALHVNAFADAIKSAAAGMQGG
jgi:hypothetical protein